MFERYSEPARRVIFYSRYMASQVGSPEIETEHLLLGLFRADMVLARRFLGSPWAAEEIWREIERSKPVRAILPGTEDLPLSTAAKRVLLLAAEEADQLSSKKIRTEHLLLGLLRDEKCLASTSSSHYVPLCTNDAQQSVAGECSDPHTARTGLLIGSERCMVRALLCFGCIPLLSDDAMHVAHTTRSAFSHSATSAAKLKTAIQR